MTGARMTARHIPSKEEAALALKIAHEMFWHTWLNAEDNGWLDAGLPNEVIARAVYQGTLKGLRAIFTRGKDEG